MNINIREHIINNFKNDDVDVLRRAIEESINEKDEIALPGMGVFLEIIWEGASEEIKNKLLSILEENIIKKWGVDTIKCTYSEDEVGDLESYYFIFSDLYKDCIYSITYPVVEGFDSENVEKVLDSIVLGTK